MCHFNIKVHYYAEFNVSNDCSSLVVIIRSLAFSLSQNITLDIHQKITTDSPGSPNAEETIMVPS